MLRTVICIKTEIYYYYYEKILNKYRILFKKWIMHIEFVINKSGNLQRIKIIWNADIMKIKDISFHWKPLKDICSWAEKCLTRETLRKQLQVSLGYFSVFSYFDSFNDKSGEGSCWKANIDRPAGRDRVKWAEK